MPQREEDKVVWNELLTEKDHELLINKLTKLSYAHVLSSERCFSDIHSNIDKIEKILVGNGDPKNSVIARMDDIEVKVCSIENTVNAIKKMLYGDLEKGANEISLVERVRSVERVASIAIKLSWIVMGALVTQIILQILKLL